MAERSQRRLALLWAALLHLGVFGFLLAATLPCSSFEALAQRLHVPAWLSPVQCSRPLIMPGPVIEASLVGAVAAPKPKPRPKPHHRPPPRHKAPPPPVKTLPPPALHPDVKAQQKVAELARKAEQAKQAQQAREQQHQAEIEEKKTAALLKQLHDIQQQRQAVDKQLAKTDQPAPAPATSVPTVAEHARSGQGGADNALAARYAAALTNVITQNWLRPDNIPKGVICPLRITQIPGGQVINVTVLSSCPFDAAGRRSVENAVRRAQPLPYRGFERVFERTITFNFKVEQ